MDHLLYGAAYYEEYLPYDRLEQDAAMMKAAGMNVVRIGESTWSTCEPQDGVFDFSHVTRVIRAMGEAGISVILGTPTYAVPTWMVKAYPDILATTHEGKALYGHRQNMDITNSAYRFYAERVIRRMMEECAHYDNVIGVQLDNETNAYDTAGPNVQHAFVKYVRAKFHDDLDAMNRAYGLDYWSNRINAWEDFPDVRGTINASLGAEFDRFQRKIAADFLMWQRGIVEPYLRPDQFITHNTDYAWNGGLRGLREVTDLYEEAKAMTIVGTDIYHETQDGLTGLQIAFGGDLSRSVKKDNYLVLETEAQGFAEWMPYPGQLRLQAYSHLASGANMVEYWHWHSIHNACETYWKGVLSHDFKENETYLACKTVGAEWQRIGSRLVNLKKQNRIAILVSSTALKGLDWFPIAASHSDTQIRYNDILIGIYRQLYEMNLECDFLWEQELTGEGDGCASGSPAALKGYDLLVIPALYAASQQVLDAIAAYTAAGGHILATYKTAFADENLKVWSDEAPHTLSKVFGISYSHFTLPKNVGFCSDSFDVGDAKARDFMELLNAEAPDTQVLASYDHPAWKTHAAITRHAYGEGLATYIGCGLPEKLLREVLADTAAAAGIAAPARHFPLILRKGTNDFGGTITYVLNYSADPQEYVCETDVDELLTGRKARAGAAMTISPWDLLILEA